MSYTSGSHTVFHHRYHIVWITKGYGRLSGRCARNSASRSSLAFCRENTSICSWKSRRILRSATSCGASRDAHRIGCRWSSRSCASATGAAFLGSGLLLHHERQHHGRCHTSVSSGARTYRRQPVVIQWSRSHQTHRNEPRNDY